MSCKPPIISTIKAELGETNETRNCLERAIALAPGYAEAHFSLGKILHVRGELNVHGGIRENWREQRLVLSP